MLTFIPGTTVVHSAHGPATVTGHETRQIKGVAVEYVKLSVLTNALSVSVPIDRASELGIRPLLSEQQIHDLFDVLRSESAPEDKQWSRRFKANAERLASGDTFTVASVARDIYRRREFRGVSTGERDQLEAAFKPIRTELRLVLDAPTEEIDQMLVAAILERGHEPREGSRSPLAS